MRLRRPHAHRLFYYRSPRRRPYFAASRKPAFKSPGSFRTEAASGRCLKLFAIIRGLPRMSAGTTGRLSANVCLDARAIASGALRKTGPAGIGREIEWHESRIFPVQSLPALFFGRHRRRLRRRRDTRSPTVVRLFLRTSSAVFELLQRV